MSFYNSFYTIQQSEGATVLDVGSESLNIFPELNVYQCREEEVFASSYCGNKSALSS